MNYEIITRGVMAYIDQIQKLADRHSVTLGFIPAKAYHQFAHDNHLYYAIKDEHVMCAIVISEAKAVEGKKLSELGRKPPQSFIRIKVEEFNSLCLAGKD